MLQKYRFFVIFYNKFAFFFYKFITRLIIKLLKQLFFVDYIKSLSEYIIENCLLYYSIFFEKTCLP